MPSDQPRPPDIERLIGSTLVRFNMLDGALREILVRMLSPDRVTAQLVVYGQDSEWIRRQLQAVAQTRVVDKQLRADLQAFLSTVGDLAGWRNRLTHDSWSIMERRGGFVLQRFRLRTSKGTVVFDSEFIAPEKVVQRIEQANELFGEMIHLSRRLEQAGAFYPGFPMS